MELQIHHIGYQDNKYMFEVIRSMDIKHTPAVSLPDPSTFFVENYPSRYFLPELRWYLEDYLQEPFGAYQQQAESVAETIKAWGRSVFDALFVGYARDWYQDAKRQCFEELRIKIASDSPEIMSWPWEALYSKDDGYLALRCCIDRQLNDIADPPPLSEELDQNVIHVLYIIPRPYKNDVGYHMLANSLISYINQNNLPVTVDVLRPPTFDQLRKVLYEHPGYYHIVHFDGHGGYGKVVPTPAENLYAAREGQLVFENDDGNPEPIDATRLAQLLAEYRIPFMVMNACRSGMIDGQAQDPFACVAAGLLRAGIRSVTAMGYSLYVSAAREFIPAFYERLFSTGRVSEAVRAGRGRMLRQPYRDCIVGKLQLQDWMVPVVYQQLSAESITLPKVQSKSQLCEECSLLPEDVKIVGDYGFIGRGYNIQKLERAMWRQPQAALLIHGQAGIGKTTFVKGFLHWLDNTHGLQEKAFWFDFQEIYSAEYVVNALISNLLGLAVTAKPMDEKLKELVRVLHNRQYLIVWDNFESASGIEGTEIKPKLSKEDRNILKQLLTGLRAGKSKVLITSRTKEMWLPIQICCPFCLEGLEGEDLWEYCNAVVKELGLTLDQEDKTYIEILKKLCGNPLAIRAILLRLQDCSAEQLLLELDSAFEGMEGDESTRRIQAAYVVFSGGFLKCFHPILQIIGLHEYYANINHIDSILQVVGYSVGQENIVSCFHILENSGFCTEVSRGIYYLHPALRGYLLQQFPASERIQKGFVKVMGLMANGLLGFSIYKVQTIYKWHLTNLYYALHLAEICDMDAMVALAKMLAYYAEEMRQFAEAQRLYLLLAQKCESDKELLAFAFYKLGIIAYERRELEVAESWCKKSLAISKKEGNEYGVGNNYYQLGNIAVEKWDLEGAEKWYKKSLIIDEKKGYKYEVASTYYQLGTVAYKRWKLEIAETWYKKSLEIFEKEGYEDRVVSIYKQLGIVAYEKEELEIAEMWCKKSLAIDEKEGNEHGDAGTYHQLGNIAEKRGDLEGAEMWYKKSLAIKEKEGNEQEVAGTYHQLGNIAEKKRDLEGAEMWYKKSLAIKEKEGDEHGAVITYNQLGIVTYWREDLKEAEMWCKKSLAVSEKEGNEHGVAVACHQLGCIAEKRRNLEGAEMWYKKSLAISEKEGNKRGVASTYNQLGEIAVKKKNFLYAAKYCLKAIVTFNQINDIRNVELTIDNYARLLHIAPDAERRKLWEMLPENISREVTKILGALSETQ